MTTDPRFLGGKLAQTDERDGDKIPANNPGNKEKAEGSRETVLDGARDPRDEEPPVLPSDEPTVKTQI